MTKQKKLFAGTGYRWGGTFHSATDGTNHSDIPGTFESDMGGTFNTLQSRKGGILFYRTSRIGRW